MAVITTAMQRDGRIISPKYLSALGRQERLYLRHLSPARASCTPPSQQHDNSITTVHTKPNALNTINMSTEEPKEELNVKGGDQPQGEGAKPAEKKGSVLSAPQNYGNAAGSAIESTLGKVGNPVGKGLSTVAAPVGGLVEPVVGGLFKSPEHFARAVDEKGNVQRENEDLERPIGGEEQTAGNPLGLNQGGVKDGEGVGK